MKKYKLLVVALFFLCGVSTIVMIICLGKTSYKTTFTPPDFDQLSKKGFPSENETAEYEWGIIDKDGMPYKMGICGKVIVRDRQAFVFFTNYEDNSVWLKLRVLNMKDHIIAESGLIKPGEYLETVALLGSVNSGEKVKLKIMAYEPETYYSAGSIVLNTFIQTGE